MGTSGLTTVSGLLVSLGYLIVLVLILIQYWNLLHELRATPPHVLPAHIVRRSVMLVLTFQVAWILLSLSLPSDRDRWTLASFLLNILGGVVMWSLIVAATIWWEMRRKTLGN